MRNRPAERPLDAIARRHDGLAGLLETARAFEALDQRLQPCLPEAARGRIRVACIESDCLVLAAASPAWASRARLLADELLLEASRQLDRSLVRTKVVVVPGMG